MAFSLRGGLESQIRGALSGRAVSPYNIHVLKSKIQGRPGEEGHQKIPFVKVIQKLKFLNNKLLKNNKKQEFC
jgi:hypothetical protein